MRCSFSNAGVFSCLLIVVALLISIPLALAEGEEKSPNPAPQEISFTGFVLGPAGVNPATEKSERSFLPQSSEDFSAEPSFPSLATMLKGTTQNFMAKDPFGDGDSVPDAAGGGLPNYLPVVSTGFSNMKELAEYGSKTPTYDGGYTKFVNFLDRLEWNRDKQEEEEDEKKGFDRDLFEEKLDFQLQADPGGTTVIVYAAPNLKIPEEYKLTLTILPKASLGAEGNPDATRYADANMVFDATRGFYYCIYPKVKFGTEYRYDVRVSRDGKFGLINVSEFTGYFTTKTEAKLREEGLNRFQKELDATRKEVAELSSLLDQRRTAILDAAKEIERVAGQAFSTFDDFYNAAVEFSQGNPLSQDLMGRLSAFKQQIEPQKLSVKNLLTKFIDYYYNLTTTQAQADLTNASNYLRLLESGFNTVQSAPAEQLDGLVYLPVREPRQVVEFNPETEDPEKAIFDILSVLDIEAKQLESLILNQAFGKHRTNLLAKTNAEIVKVEGQIAEYQTNPEWQAREKEIFSYLESLLSSLSRMLQLGVESQLSEKIIAFGDYVAGRGATLEALKRYRTVLMAYRQNVENTSTWDDLENLPWPESYKAGLDDLANLLQSGTQLLESARGEVTEATIRDYVLGQFPGIDKSLYSLLKVEVETNNFGRDNFEPWYRVSVNLGRSGRPGLVLRYIVGQETTLDASNNPVKRLVIGASEETRSVIPNLIPEPKAKSVAFSAFYKMFGYIDNVLMKTSVAKLEAKHLEDGTALPLGFAGTHHVKYDFGKNGPKLSFIVGVNLQFSNLYITAVPTQSTQEYLANAPSVLPLKVETQEDKGIMGDLIGKSPNNEELTYGLFEPSVYGSVEVTPEGRFKYMPSAGFSGTDYFRYVATDGSDISIPREFIIYVKPAPGRPSFRMSGIISTATAGETGQSQNPVGFITRADLKPRPLVASWILTESWNQYKKDRETLKKLQERRRLEREQAQITS